MQVLRGHLNSQEERPSLQNSVQDFKDVFSASFVLGWWSEAPMCVTEKLLLYFNRQVPTSRYCAQQSVSESAPTLHAEEIPPLLRAFCLLLLMSTCLEPFSLLTKSMQRAVLGLELLDVFFPHWSGEERAFHHIHRGHGHRDGGEGKWLTLGR